jgi:hypothetical protein
MQIKDEKMSCIKLLKVGGGRCQRGLWLRRVLCDVLFYILLGTGWYFHTRMVQYGEEVCRTLEHRASYSHRSFNA